MKRARDGIMHCGWLLPALLAAGCAGGESREPTDDEPVVVSILADRTVTAPGDSLTLGWRLAIADGWHVYWNGRNDTGFSPEVELTLPEGWQAGPLLWPAAERHVSAGDILDHVYHHQVTLLQQIKAPREAKPGSRVIISAELSWLVCRDMCIPGDTTVTVEISVAAEPAPPTADEATLQRVFRELPRPAIPGEINAWWNQASLEVVVPAAHELEFHPFEDAGDLIEPIGGAISSNDTLSLDFRLKEERAGPARGLLKVSADGKDPYHLILNMPATTVADASNEGEMQ